ncbi:unnamed protein product [Phytophthora lilii]|uniref:Unnamed protein product n=1 Tax=Phytophthora lilii TaxID=2077276 RepID=A0A9W7CMS2_9STRA|nr:unnamed protein product [Phytophthora lilii]
MFKKLKLQGRNGYLFGTENMRLWEEKVAALNKKNPEQGIQSMLTTLLKHYDDNSLARYIESAKDSISVAKLAKKLQAAQFKKWLDARTTANTIRNNLIETQGTCIRLRKFELLST